MSRGPSSSGPRTLRSNERSPLASVGPALSCLDADAGLDGFYDRRRFPARGSADIARKARRPNSQQRGLRFTHIDGSPFLAFASACWAPAISLVFPKPFQSQGLNELFGLAWSVRIPQVSVEPLALRRLSAGTNQTAQYQWEETNEAH